MKTTPPYHGKPSIATQDIEMEDNELVVLSKPRRQRSYSSSSLSLSSAISRSLFSKASCICHHDCYINSTSQDYNYDDRVHKKQQELSAATEQEDQLYCQEDHHGGDNDDDDDYSEKMKKQHHYYYHHHHQQQQQYHQRRLYQNLRRIKRRLFLEQVTQ
jgi:hypothetical protein